MRKVVFFSLVHRFDDTRIVHKEARSLVEGGYKVIHLCPAASHDELPAPDVGHEISGVKIATYGSRCRGQAGVILRHLAGFVAAFRQNADIYHCNEPESWIFGCFIKMLRFGRPRVVFDVHEHYPSRFDEPHVSRFRRSVGKPVLKAAFRFLPSITDHIFLAKHSVAEEFRHVQNKTTLIFNYTPRFALNLPPVAQDPFKQIRDESDLLLIHVGAFSRWRGWPQALEAMALARSSRVHLVGLGRVSEGKEVLLEHACKLGIADRVSIIDSVPYAEMFDYLRCADVGLMLYQPGILNHIYAFPMKLYDYMAASIPVIGPDFAVEVTPVIEETECGILLDTSDSQALAKAIDFFATNPEKRVAMGESGRRGVETLYVWEREAEKLLAVYRSISGPA